MSPERWGVGFSADCPNIRGHGYLCMVCDDPATGHAAVRFGSYHGRCLALLCPLHASAEGFDEFKHTMLIWLEAGLLDVDGGPGLFGTPQARHGDHLDPMPECAYPDE
jgi:hypothetical protein